MLHKHHPSQATEPMSTAEVPSFTLPHHNFLPSPQREPPRWHEWWSLLFVVKTHLSLHFKAVELSSACFWTLHKLKHIVKDGPCFFCSTLFIRSICILEWASGQSPFLFFAIYQQYSAVWLFHNLFYHSTPGGHFGCSHFGATMSDALWASRAHTPGLSRTHI